MTPDPSQLQAVPPVSRAPRAWGPAVPKLRGGLIRPFPPQQGASPTLHPPDSLPNQRNLCLSPQASQTVFPHPAERRRERNMSSPPPATFRDSWKGRRAPPPLPAPRVGHGACCSLCSFCVFSVCYFLSGGVGWAEVGMGRWAWGPQAGVNREGCSLTCSSILPFLPPPRQ